MRRNAVPCLTPYVRCPGRRLLHYQDFCIFLRPLGGRDRSAARTTVGGEFPPRALSIREVGASCHLGPRFRRPPCDPGRWAFPSPVLPLASLWSPSQRAHSLRADSPTPCRSVVCFPGRSLGHRPSRSGYAWSCHVPSAPWHVHGVTVHVRLSRTMSAGLPPHLHRSSGRMRPSSPLRVPRSYPQHQVGAGCRQPRLGGGPSRRCLCASFPPCLDLSPGGSSGAQARCFPQDLGLPPVRTGAALHHGRTATAGRRPLRGWSHCVMCRPAGVLTTQGAPPATACAAWQPWFLRPRLSWFVPSPRPGYTHRPHRAIDGMRTFTSSEAQPCRLLPERRA